MEEGSCPVHGKLVDRIDALSGRIDATEEASSKSIAELRGLVVNMANDVSALHQTMIKAIDDKTSVMPRSVRIGVFVPSALVTLVSIIWLFEHIPMLFK